MDGSIVAQILKIKRTELNLSAKAVVKKLQDFGIYISDKTLYGWESGHRKPDGDVFLILCHIYGIDSLEGLDAIPQIMNQKPSMSAKAKKLAEDFDTLDEFGKKAVRRTANTEIERMKAQNMILTGTTASEISAPATLEQKADAVAAKVREQVILEEKVGAESSASPSDTGGTAGEKMA